MRRSLEMPLRISEPLSTTVGQTTLAPVRAESFSISLVTSSYTGSARASLPVGAAPGMGSRNGLARGSSSAAVGMGKGAGVLLRSGQGSTGRRSPGSWLLPDRLACLPAEVGQLALDPREIAGCVPALLARGEAVERSGLEDFCLGS